MSKSYNGWSNYETWCVALWLSNDETKANETIPEMARQACRFTGSHDASDTVSALAQLLKNYVTDDAPDLGASVYSDMLHAALSEVDWYEIALRYREPIDEYFAEIAQ